MKQQQYCFQGKVSWKKFSPRVKKPPAVLLIGYAYDLGGGQRGLAVSPSPPLPPPPPPLRLSGYGN